VNTRIFSASFALAVALGLAPIHAQDAVLRSGDTVELRIGGVPIEEIQQVSGPYTVDGEGFLNLPHIGKVRAASSTQAQVQAAIESGYRSQQIYTNPSITLLVPDTARFVNTTGEVKAPQRVQFTADLTLLGAISASGGFTEFANRGQVRLLRDQKTTIFNAKEILKDPSKDIRLKPGDQVDVPTSFW
jgi:protein involved in polysaccharide export with SLBB domain